MIGVLYPRKASPGDHADDNIDDVIWNLNSTLRKCPGYRTPIDALVRNLGIVLKM